MPAPEMESSSPSAPGMESSSSTTAIESQSIEKVDDLNKQAESADIEKQAPAAPVPPVYAPNVPDGGLKAWLTVVGAWLVLFSTFGYINAFGVYENYYLETTGEDASTIAWIGALQLFMQFSLGAVVGPLFDKGYFRGVTIFGSVVYVFGLFMTSLGKTYYQFLLAQGVTAGMGAGILFMPTMSVISHHFAKRRALAAGVVVSGSSVGGVCLPIMLNNLLNNGTSFGWTVRASAFLVLGCLVLAQLLMSSRFEEMGIRAKPKPDMKGIVTDPVFQLSAAGFFFITLGVFLGFFYTQVYALAEGIDPTLSFYYLAIINGASTFGRTVPNFAADYFGCFNLLTICITITGILLLVFPTADTAASLIVWSICYGFFSGSYISLLAPSLMSTARHPSEIGARMGLPFLIIAVAALIGTPIIGYILGDGNPTDYHWWSASIFSGVVVLAGTALIFVTRTVFAKRKGTQKV